MNPPRKIASTIKHEQPIIGTVAKSVVLDKKALRNVLGDLAEDYIKKLIDAQRIVVQPGHICPDLIKGDKLHFEVKSIGVHNSVMLSRESVTNYNELMQRRQQLYYAFVFHDLRIREGQTLASFKRAYASHVQRVLFVEAGAMHRKLKLCKQVVHVAKQKYRIYATDFERYWHQAKNKKIALPVNLVRSIWTEPVQVGMIGESFWPSSLLGVSDTTQEALDAMCLDLRQQHLTVGLAPALNPQNGRKVRVALETNPAWYSDLCQTYSRNNGRRKWETIIDRRRTTQTLNQLATGQPVRFDSFLRLWPFIEQVRGEIQDERDYWENQA